HEATIERIEEMTGGILHVGVGGQRHEQGGGTGIEGANRNMCSALAAALDAVDKVATIGKEEGPAVRALVLNKREGGGAGGGAAGRRNPHDGLGDIGSEQNGSVRRPGTAAGPTRRHRAQRLQVASAEINAPQCALGKKRDRM